MSLEYYLERAWRIDSGFLWAIVAGYGTKASLSVRVSGKDVEKMRKKAHKPQPWGISIAKENMYTGAVGTMVAAVVAAAVSLIWNINKVNKKKKMLATAVQYLWDEQ